MKCCSRCKVEKDLTDFCKTKRSKDGYQPACKSCMAISYNASRQKKKSHYDQVQRRRTKNNTILIREWKEARGCSFCSENFGPCLELHHLDPNEKDIDPSDAAQYSFSKFLSEAKKCIVVCANCHRKVHHGLLNVDDITKIE